MQKTNYEKFIAYRRDQLTGWWKRLTDGKLLFIAVYVTLGALLIACLAYYLYVCRL